MTNHYARTAALIATALLSLMAGACSFDYLSNLDRMTLAGGDAVQTNLEQQTVNPAGTRSYKTTGLGANGSVVPKTSTEPAKPVSGKAGT